MPTAEESVPFRWDLVTADQLGSLLAGTTAPDLWFLDDLVVCAGKVLARSGNGDLVFVGRSLDTMFDLLGGALADRADGAAATAASAVVPAARHRVPATVAAAPVDCRRADANAPDPRGRRCDTARPCPV